MSQNQTAVVSWIGELVAGMSPKIDGSKILHHLWSEYPQLYLPDTVNALQGIMSRLVSSDSAVRADGLIVLSGFSCATLSLWASTRTRFKAAILREVRKFLFDADPQDLGKRPPPGAQLPQFIDRAVKEDTSGAPLSGPRWAVTVICCLILLSGHGVFAGVRLRNFVIRTVEQVANSKKKPGDELLLCAWRALIWAFSQIPRDADRPQEHTEADVSPESRTRGLRGSAFQLLKQELRGGMGICLVVSLLHAHPADPPVTPDPDLVRVASVLKEMISHRSEDIYRNGVVVLERLVGAIGTAEDASTTTAAPWTPDDIPIKAMFSRRLLEVDVAVFCSTIRETARIPSSAVRSLREQEIQQVWKDLLEIWAISVRRELRRTEFTELPYVLVQVWQALLLVQTHLTQGRAHLTSSPDSTNFVVSVVADFLDWSPPTDVKRPPLPENVVQRRVLCLCSQLWNVMKNVFSDSWLSSASGSLLGSVVRHTFDFSLEDVKTAWSQLRSFLVSANAPDLIGRLVAETKKHQAVDIQRGLWLLAADTWISRDPVPSWTNSVEFLTIPLRHWTMDEADLSIWNAILTHAVSQALSVAEPCLAVFDAIVERGFQAPIRLLNHPKMLLHLLSSFKLLGEVCGTSIFLWGVGAVLRDLYTDLPENVSTAVQALAHIRRILEGCPTNAILAVLSCLADGLAVWIGDEAELLLVQEHNDVVIPLYCNALDALKKIPISADTLQALAPFLCSAFVRIPEPGRGPLAFCDFWKDVQPSLAHLNGAYPEEIKSALRASHDVLGIDVPVDISLSTESHTDGRSLAWTSPVKSPRTTVEVGYTTSGRRRPSTSSPLRQMTTPADNTHVSPFLTSSGPKRQASYGPAEAASPATPPRGSNRDASRSSDFVPSSPTEALRARRLAAGPSSRVTHQRPKAPSDRPVKRRRLSPPTESPTVRPPEASAESSKRGPSAATSVASRRSKWRFDGVEVEMFKGPKRRTSTAGSSTPKPSKDTGARIPSPEVPSPADAARAVARSSDDYDAWEVPICADDDMYTVPDSQPSGDEGDDDSMLPSFMKEREDRDQQRPNDTDVLDDPADADDVPIPSKKKLGERPQHTSRTHTAPASFLRGGSSTTERGHTTSGPLQRANTAYAQLEGLQNVYDMLEQEGSQLDPDQMVAASALTHRIGTLLSEKLSKKLYGNGSGGPRR
ncbi:hypothetical protein DICSQDRAFT_160507 [Dichomitus squalens LYAD-421 SS1]|uniref:uncharacterized protein n=1 Tax=Dichomitus squalens (strain LYAD-421) TaxID=732165 RepID=UPI0004410767|nr:uncharacterized protein DICSQDRAFT_160507 [Dichomitus squalens LYAD-421 SS1]EJF63296.1 hypothetical protein DICSQDRAFT_160507 [Dichomitus squalens LYAD-421 SS1]